MNGDRADNRLTNLRDVSRSANQRNAKMQRNNTSGANGVYWWPARKKWRAEMKIEGVARHLGLYSTREEAAKARAAANAKHGFTLRHGQPA